MLNGYPPLACLLTRMLLLLLAKQSENHYIIYRGNDMASKVKPVQPTEIKDKKIARQVIEDIRKPIPQSVYKRHKKNAKFFEKMFKK